jgi:VacB/RNase II family 3'-5' exoribonuclease
MSEIFRDGLCGQEVSVDNRDSVDNKHRSILQRIARRVMLERGLLPDFSPAALDELGRIGSPALVGPASQSRDLRSLLWCSIDNDDSRDLDQLTVAEALSGGLTRILVAIADVDSLVKQGSAINGHARHNTTSIYTAAEIFPMLPEKLSTGFTSLNPDEDRLAVVIEMVIDAGGNLNDSSVYTAAVRNHAKLAYNSVAAWLAGTSPMPGAVAAVQGLAENLQLQDQVAQSLKSYRHIHGALSLETIEAKPVFDQDELRDLVVWPKNRATEIIEDFMVAANGVTARFLSAHKFPSIRRVVRIPQRWDRIVQIAADHKYELPSEPSSKALDEFLLKMKDDDPERFPDLSLSVIKLLGSGEYVAEFPGDEPIGHFGLAVKDYSHSTAPNRRYPDLLTQRLLKSALLQHSVPYSRTDLEELANHCTLLEDVANKVERQVGKSAAALLLQSRIGEQFDAVVTGASDKGTWVRLFSLPVEGKLVLGIQGADVGDRFRVQLLSVDVENGFIDFKRVGSHRS